MVAFSWFFCWQFLFCRASRTAGARPTRDTGDYFKTGESASR
jgi:hypothetical protein